jgi:hypothetical protein
MGAKSQPISDTGNKAMAHKAFPASALAARKGIRSLSEMSASGVYQFRGAGGERITMINKEKLRESTAGVSLKGKN